MQTFLPYSDFKLTASILDCRRLGKQRIEAYQILCALKTGPFQCKNCGHGLLFRNVKDKNFCSYCDTHNVRNTPWYNHPATRMWTSFEYCLQKYIHEICAEWRVREYKDSIENKTYELSEGNSFWKDTGSPPWLGDSRFHDSHKSNLLRKFPEYYRKFWPEFTNSLPYYWPVNYE